MILVLAAACHTAPAGSSLGGAESPRAAVEKYLAAARAQDLQALGVVWGDEKGPTRDHLPREELEKREFVMLCLLKHDQARIGEPVAAVGGRYTMQVELTQGQVKANVKFTVAKGPSNRWYVQDFDSQLLQNAGFCKKPA
ncbi:MAG: hypothetical protein ACHQQR_00165 [Gemmatimonadales bacterium]